LFAVGVQSVFPAVANSLLHWDNLPEASALYSGTGFPHFGITYLALTMALSALILAWRGGRPGRATITALAAGVLFALGHTFMLLPTLALFGLAGVAAVGRNMRSGGTIAGLAGIGLVATACLAPALPALIGLHQEGNLYRALQGRSFPKTPAGAWPFWMCQYWLLLPFGVAGLVGMGLALYRRRPRTGVDPAAMGLLCAFAAILVFLIITPRTPFQRRFSEGLVIPLAAVASVSLSSMARVRQRMLPTVLAAAAFAGLIRVSGHGVYLPASHQAVFDRIGPSDVVLAGDLLGQIIPAFSDGTVYMGRPTETLRFQDKVAVRRAFASAASPEAIGQLRAAGVTLILIDTTDDSFRLGAPEPREPCLHELFRVGTVTGFRLRELCGARPLSGDKGDLRSLGS
jgi:hypothetical protein